MIDIDNVSYFFKDSGAGDHSDGIKNINLRIEDGEFVSIIGPSGVGKSTLIKLLSGEIQPDCGKATLDGEPIDSRRKEISIMYQSNQLFPWWTLKKNISFFVHNSYKEKNKSEVDKEVCDLLKKANLYEARDKYPYQLSGGMHQRGLLIRSYATRSKVLLLDEPFSALDISNKHQMQDLLTGLSNMRKKTIVMVTHDIYEAIFLADRILYMNAFGNFTEWKVPFGRPRNRTNIIESKEYCKMEYELLSRFNRETIV